MDVKQRMMTHPHPSVRVCALLALGERPADDPQVAASRALIPKVPPVRDILAAQYPAGHWMHPGLGISPHYRATLWQVLFLAQLGVGPIPEMTRAIEVLRRDNLDDMGAFHLRRGACGQSPALTGAFLWAVNRLGLQDAADWSLSWRWVSEEIDSDRVATADVVWFIRASAAWQRELCPVPAAIWEQLEWPDRVPVLPETALTFPVALEPDLLTLMATCVEAGAPARIPSLAVDWLANRQLPSDDWPLEHVPGRLWCAAGEIGQPNPWVTVRALSVLDAVS
jgi:hypothetical protein